MGYYDGREPDVTIDVLGTEYSIYMNVPQTEDKILDRIDGYCDKTVKRIVIAKMTDECNLGDQLEYVKYVVRHELIHAFLFESGIGGDTKWDIGDEHPEHMVEWIAMQFSKIQKAYETLGVI